MTKIELEGGKYTVIHNNGDNFKALRYGEDWRDLTGDGLILALVQRIEQLEEKLEDTKEWLFMYENSSINSILKDDPMFKDGR